MDSGTVVIGAIMIIICVAPFVIMHFSGIKRDNKMLQSLNELAQQQSCKITQTEFCGDFVVGLDEEKNVVFFFKQKREEAISEWVDLSEIQTCQTEKKTRTVGVQGGGVITERVELAFTPVNTNKSPARFELYDDEINIQMNGELQFADKWSEQLNARLKNR